MNKDTQSVQWRSDDIKSDSELGRVIDQLLRTPYEELTEFERKLGSVILGHYHIECLNCDQWFHVTWNHVTEERKMVTIRELAKLTGKKQQAVRQRIFKARESGELKTWRKSGWVILVDLEEALALVMQDRRRKVASS